MKKILILALLAYLVSVAGCDYIKDITGRGDVYNVVEVLEHNPRPGQNSDTTLRIKVDGAGHVVDVICWFPPKFSLDGNANDGWTGIAKIRVGDVANVYAFGVKAFWCERVR